MLNIGKLAAGGEAYYLDTVASGVEDYYTGAGEAPGYWLTAAAGDLGLSGQVDADDLRAVLAATDPGSGERLVSARSRRAVPGFDLAFRAPKSVSLLYGLGDEATAEAVRAAHDAAVAAAVGWLETEAARSRRGHGGSERVAVTGFVAAAFRHRSSRARDPLLHTHVLVANLAQTVDDQQWRTLDTAALYTHAKTAGYLYQAQLRHQLTATLGVEWTAVRNGYADVAGVPRHVIDAFSQRRQQILEQLAERGESSAKAAQAATLDTRQAKQRGAASDPVLRDEWQRRGRDLGFAADQVTPLLPTPGLQPAALGPDPDCVAQRLLGSDGLTARALTFTRRDALRGCCEQLPAGAPIHDITALTDRLLAAPGSGLVRLDQHCLTGGDVLRRADGSIVAVAADEPRYSTAELLACEQQIIASATSRRHADVAIVDDPVVDAALARRPSIGPDQAAMVRRLTTSGAGVEVVVGAAGTGKTFALDAAREAWQAAGHRVIGAALAARAAAELRDGAGIPSTTVNQLLADLARPTAQGGGLAAGTVLVLDEAAMIGTRQLAPVLDAAERAEAKVVLVGDHHQLPEIDAGGAFAGLTNRLPVVELTDNRRQRRDVDRRALAELRDGDPHTAVKALDAGGRMVAADTAEAAREALVGDWYAARTEHGHDGLMIAARQSDVDDLNARARHRLLAEGQLAGTQLVAGGRVFAVGDQVVATENRWVRDSHGQRVRLRNGDRGRVTAVEHHRRQIQIDVTDRTVTVPTGYLDDGKLAHGYAVTAHKAQGATVERSWVLGSDAIYREWGYTALSRHRDTTRLYVVAGGDTAEHTCAVHHQRDSRPQPHGTVEKLANRLTRSHAKQLASDHAGHPPVPPSRTSPLSAAVPSGGPDRELQRVDQERQRAAAQLDRARRIAEQTATDTERARGRLGRLARRRDTTAAGQRSARAAQDVGRWQQRLDDLEARYRHLARRAEPEPFTGRPAGSDMAGDFALWTRLRRFGLHVPAYLDAALGPPPDGGASRRSWRAAGDAVERYRDRYQVADPNDALGARPAEPRQRAAYDAAQRTVQTARLAGQPAIEGDLGTAIELA